jgi:hypothetical protein
MTDQNSNSERAEDLEEMLEEYDGPSIAEYAESKDRGMNTHVSNTLTPE